jgi:hypothetical protein
MSANNIHINMIIIKIKSIRDMYLLFKSFVISLVFFNIKLYREYIIRIKNPIDISKRMYFITDSKKGIICSIGLFIKC